MSKGKIIVLSGPSGVGKGTVVKRVVELDENTVLSVSATTRKIRNSEVDGIHYFFITHEQFEKKIKNGEMLEYSCYNGNYYGTIKSQVDELLMQGKNVMLEIDVNGAMQIKKKIPDAITVFLTAPSVEETERRLRGRNTESEEVIIHRLEIAKGEMQHASEYDYIVCNDSVDNAAGKMIEILYK